MAEWFESAEFWRDFQPFMFGWDTRARAADEVEGILTLLSAPAGSTLLDACCGFGRHSIALALRGYRVTGVDLTRRYLDEGRRDARKAGAEVEWVEQDVRTFKRPRAFAGAINLFSSFGYFSDPADDLRFLRNLRASLKPGGRLLIDLKGKESLAAGFLERTWTRVGDAIVLEEHRLLDSFSSIETTWTLVREGKRPRPATFRLRLYSAVELAAALRAAGFREVDLFGDFEGSPYDHAAHRMVAVAER